MKLSAGPEGPDEEDDEDDEDEDEDEQSVSAQQETAGGESDASAEGIDGPVVGEANSNGGKL